MKKFEGILFCTDLDGTLLGSDHKISKENIEAIRYFQSEGGLFTFLTGRMPFCAADIYQVLQPNAPFGCINGGGIYDHRTGKYVWTLPLDDAARELVRYVDERMPEIGIQVNTFDNIWFCRENAAMERFRRITGMPNLTSHYDKVPAPLAKIIFGDLDEARIMEVKKLLDAHPLASQFGFIRSERTLYEIVPKGVDKGTLLKKLAEVLHVDIHRTVAAGDYDNDVSMIKAAGIGYAVANACEAAKRCADRITVSNDEHAIARIIEELGG